jgi:hypothetical protein
MLGMLTSIDKNEAIVVAIQVILFQLILEVHDFLL